MSLVKGLGKAYESLTASNDKGVFILDKPMISKSKNPNVNQMYESADEQCGRAYGG